MDDNPVELSGIESNGGTQQVCDWEELGGLIRKAVDRATESLFDVPSDFESTDGAASHHDWMDDETDESRAVVTIAGDEQD